MKRFRFGVHVLAPSGHDDLVRIARQAEDLGFSVLTVPDHLIDGCLGPFAALGVVAEATTTLRIGTLVLNNGLRHPAVVAREALALDVLSDGRVELGIGAGSPTSRAEYESIGFDFEDGPTRLSRLTEAVDVLDGLLRGNEVTFAGDHYRLIGHRSWPAPVQRDRPPLLVGGSGRAVLRMAGRRADVISVSGLGNTTRSHGRPVSGLSPGAVDERVAIVRDASAGRDVELEAQVLRVIITDDRGAAVETLRESLPDLSVEDIVASPYLWIGTVESICEHIRHARDRWGLTYFTVFQDSVTTVAPILSRLARA